MYRESKSYFRGAVIAAVFGSAAVEAAPSGPSSGAYSFSGVIAASAPSGGAKCPAVGETVSGDAYITENRKGFEGHFLSTATVPAWGFSVRAAPPTLLTFGEADQGVIDYAVVPAADRLQGDYNAISAPVAANNTTAFKLIFAVASAPIAVGASATGVCKVRYNLNFTRGVAPRIQNFLKGLL